MIGAGELRGIMAMMPGFTTDSGSDIHAERTVDVNRLRDGVDKMIAAGAGVITTTGSFGEATNLLPEEFETLVRATVQAVRRRVPVVVGCIARNTREALSQLRTVQDAGADAAMCSVPYYFPSTVENAIRYYRDVATEFPKLGVLIYHNPTLHRITLPVSAFESLVKIPNVVGMKDSHRTPEEFIQLQRLVRDKMSIFVLMKQYCDYAALGAAGIWSIDVWMGPEPLIRLKELVETGRTSEAHVLVDELLVHYDYARDLCWREMGHKLAIKYAGFVDPGPLRPPFTHVPPEVDEHLRRRARYWRSLCDKYGLATV